MRRLSPILGTANSSSIAILNYIADWRLVLLNNCWHWPPFEKPAERAAQATRVPAGPLRGTDPRCAARRGLLPQKSQGQMSSRPVVSKSGKFRLAKRPPLRRAMAAIIPSGAVMGRPLGGLHS